MDKEFLQKFGKRIKDLRKIKGYTQDEFSFRANLSRSTLGNIETAQNDVTLSKVKQIADACEISPTELFMF